MKKNLFIISIVQDRVSYGGWVSFSHLQTLDEMFGSNVHNEFTQYCQKHGCTLTKIDGVSKAPWSDFEKYLLGESPDD